MVNSCYTAGPMSGYEHFNFALFDEASDFLRSLGWTVYNPADHDREIGINPDQPLPEWWSLSHAMRWDLARVAETDAIVFLPGWEQSIGSNKEARVGLDTGSEFFLYDNSNGVKSLIPLETSYVAKVVASNCTCREFM